MKKLATLLTLYFAQGLPFGFQATALPLMLRERGVSLQAIGFATVLATPWLAKPLWAPWVDRYGSRRFGRRKSWIVPMQAALVICALLAARTQNEVTLCALIFAMNLFAATQDIAVDALAVSWLEPDELGPGNAVQVVGYKLGMLTGGGLLVWASGSIGWSGLFNAMAALLFAVLCMSVVMHEPASEASGRGELTTTSLRAVLARLGRAFRQPAMLALIVLVMTYKSGETLVDAMWKPMLFDRGFTAPQIGLWTGTFGMLFSLIGSSVAGFSTRRLTPATALLWAAIMRASGVAAEWWLSWLAHPSASSVIVVTCVEHLVGGAITTVMFALMMRHTDREIGGTHYTLLASLEVWGKLPLAALSGLLAAGLGYPGLFALGTGLCVAFVGLVAVVRPRLSAA